MLLLYCMTQDDVLLDRGKIAGVSGEEVRDIAKNGVRYFYGEWDPPKSAEQVKEQALAFHRANQTIFEHTTIIPFRFPTSVPSQTELAVLMESTSSEYATELVRLHGAVQMKVLVDAPAADIPPAPATSGTEYLKQRQRAASPVNGVVKKIEDATSPLVHEVKRSHRGDAVILYLLLQRERQEELKHAFSLLSDLQAAVTISGPWPPSEFVNCYPEIPEAEEIPKRS